MKRFFTTFGPGLLIAATGVGAGDLATSALAGSNIGLVAIWAIVIGGLIKYQLNLGLAKWQFDTTTTLIEGAVGYYGLVARYAFLGYLMVWSFTVGVALMSASGVALHALLPLLEDAYTAKVIYGCLLSLLGVVLVRAGGFRRFEWVMSMAVILMLLAVGYTMFILDVGVVSIADVPMLPDGDQLPWFIAVLGGVGGTVTVLCYGYWIKAHNRKGQSGFKTSRVDLGLSYLITVLLGICMVVIGSKIEIAGSGVGLLVNISDVLKNHSGSMAAIIFRVGAFAAIFSSLLGVWQSVPYLFVNLINLINQRQQPSQIDEASKPYRRFLYAIAFIPIIGLPIGFAKMQQIYALCGAAFIPLLAFTLILLGVKAKSNYQPSKYVVLIYYLILAGSIFLLFGTLA